MNLLLRSLLIMPIRIIDNLFTDLPLFKFALFPHIYVLRLTQQPRMRVLVLLGETKRRPEVPSDVWLRTRKLYFNLVAVTVSE